MAGRFLPQKDVNLITRVTRELVGDKQNNKDGIINQECVVYKPSLQESVTNMYGEAAGGKKVYKNGVQLNALRQSFIDASMVLEIGDLIDWNYGYFEIGTINENQLIGGQFDQNYSVIANSFLVRKSSIQIERVRSI